jgi:hypothetical protein
MPYLANILQNFNRLKILRDINNPVSNRAYWLLLGFRVQIAHLYHHARYRDSTSNFLFYCEENPIGHFVPTQSHGKSRIWEVVPLPKKTFYGEEVSITHLVTRDFLYQERAGSNRKRIRTDHLGIRERKR